jgi:hypothetical protein
MAFNEVMLEEYKPMEVAAIMVAQALSIYKTVLTEDEYHKMIDYIHDRKDEVQTFQGPNIQ